MTHAITTYGTSDARDIAGEAGVEVRRGRFADAVHMRSEGFDLTGVSGSDFGAEATDRGPFASGVSSVCSTAKATEHTSPQNTPEGTPRMLQGVYSGTRELTADDSATQADIEADEKVLGSGISAGTRKAKALLTSTGASAGGPAGEPNATPRTSKGISTTSATHSTSATSRLDAQSPQMGGSAVRSQIRKEISQGNAVAAAPAPAAAAITAVKAFTEPIQDTKRDEGASPFAVILGVAASLIVGVFAFVFGLCMICGYEEPPRTGNLPDAVEAWRPVVSQACTEIFGDDTWATFVLCLMAAESGGDVNVSSVTGAKGDIMQASEGAYGNVIRYGATKDIGAFNGAGNVWLAWPYSSVSPNTPEASIYAGVLEFKQNLELWESWAGEITPADTGKLGLIAQGYNYGAHGWFSWCKRNNVTSYTVEDSKRYQTTLPAGLKGTANHGQKVLDFYMGASVSGNGVEAVERALTKLGCPYVWGASGPDTFDCSGLVCYALTGEYAHPWTTYTFMAWPRVSSPQPGDICTTNSHCGIYIGNGQMIHAPHTGDVVRIAPVQSSMIYVRYPG